MDSSGQEVLKMPKIYASNRVVLQEISILASMGRVQDQYVEQSGEDLKCSREGQGHWGFPSQPRITMSLIDESGSHRFHFLCLRITYEPSTLVNA
ncbi:unnamed protein product [Cyprideis torosa]|uniref:Uncharacterized protein n=1 Tax=Cyprideis torosa TaxID=163714 RepID=A0A7R8WHI0_9CRUS|nr:unnamed protein product [Cyprideis torosa]CAG0899373.1 unnamed protein product [Cyprideis torosa]